jgi:hypothetical protein
MCFQDAAMMMILGQFIKQMLKAPVIPLFYPLTVAISSS